MNKITQAVILAGGAGTRLRPFTLNNPKPMVRVNGKPFLEHLIRLLRRNGISEIIILTGYLGHKIEEYFGDGSKYQLKIKYSYTPFTSETGEELESGLRLKNAEKLLNDYFLLLYCDNYWPLQLDILVDYFNNHPCEALITVYSNKDHSTKNNIKVDPSGFVTRYDKSRQTEGLNSVDIGFFILHKKLLGLLPKTNSQFETQVLPVLIQNRLLCAFLTDHKYYSISDPYRVKLTEQFLEPKKVVFLDRDGVINQKPAKSDYVKSWPEFVFLPRSIEAIKQLNQKGYQVFVISNQAGIARGLMTEENLHSIHQNLILELARHGAKIDGFYYCPHGWDEGCDCRKPKPGLLHQASREHFIDLTKSTFIGDDERDLSAGNAAGCQTIILSETDTLFEVVKTLTSQKPNLKNFNLPPI